MAYRRRFADRLGLWPRALGFDLSRFRGSELRRRREAAGLTTTEFGVLVGASHALLCRIECGEARPTPLDVLIFAALLRCEPANFFPPRAAERPDLRDLVGVAADEPTEACVGMVA